jgi:hypothetical protein
MRVVRVWLPVAIVVGGIIAIIATGGSLTGWEGGVAIIAAGISVWLLNVIFRVGVAGERERDAEDAARDFYAEHGYWPDEVPPDPPAPADAGSGPARDPHRRAAHDDRSHRPPGRSGGAARRPPRRP